mmetsp:Transcript_541/g.1056  ORF Transcript_541/g.1056 Transcript_541/m.1056 type:complete len:331 (+) Transcript_541:874-1866(+)
MSGWTGPSHAPCAAGTCTLRNSSTASAQTKHSPTSTASTSPPSPANATAHASYSNPIHTCLLLLLTLLPPLLTPFLFFSLFLSLLIIIRPFSLPQSLFQLSNPRGRCNKSTGLYLLLAPTAANRLDPETPTTCFFPSPATPSAATPSAAPFSASRSSSSSFSFSFGCCCCSLVCATVSAQRGTVDGDGNEDKEDALESVRVLCGAADTPAAVALFDAVNAACVNAYNAYAADDANAALVVVVDDDDNDDEEWGDDVSGELVLVWMLLSKRSSNWSHVVAFMWCDTQNVATSSANARSSSVSDTVTARMRRASAASANHDKCATRTTCGAV